MIHLKIEQVAGKTIIDLDEAALAALGVGVGDFVSIEAREDHAIEQGKAFVERYIKTFEALAK